MWNSVSLSTTLNDNHLRCRVVVRAEVRNTVKCLVHILCWTNGTIIIMMMSTDTLLNNVLLTFWMFTYPHLSGRESQWGLHGGLAGTLVRTQLDICRHRALGFLISKRYSALQCIELNSYPEKIISPWGRSVSPFLEGYCLLNITLLRPYLEFCRT